jgi:hypothetical protein
VLAVRLFADGAGTARIDALPLPFLFNGPTSVDRDHVAGPPAGHHFTNVEPTTVEPPGRDTVPTRARGRQLMIVVSGHPSVTGSYQQADLAPGDVLLVDGPPQGEWSFLNSEPVRLLVVSVADAWEPSGVVPPPVADLGLPLRDSTRLSHIEVPADGDLAYFRPFDHLFEQAGKGQSIESASLLCFSPHLFGDWHVEAAPTLVAVLTGGFELQVGGSDEPQVFMAGDVCLVEDTHGQGHITRVHGETRIAALRLPADHIWATSKGAAEAPRHEG